MNIKYLCAALTLVGLAGCQYTSPDVTVEVGSEYVTPNDLLINNGTVGNANVPANLLGLDGVNVDAFTKDADGKMIFSIDAMHLVSGALIRPGDVFRCDDANCATLTKLVDVEASSQLPLNTNVDAVTIDKATGDLLISVDRRLSYLISSGGFPPIITIVQVTKADVLRWDTSAQTFKGSRLFNGSDLAKQGINVDAIDSQVDQLNISFDVTVTLPKDGGGTLTVPDDHLAYWKPSTNTYTGASTSNLPENADADAFYLNIPPPSGDAIFSDGFE